MSQQPTLFLHDHPVSSYAQKIRLALREKALPFTKSTPSNLGSGTVSPTYKSSPLYTANPRMEVPALVVTSANGNETAIFDSTVILEYLEDAFPASKRLLPREPLDRAKARMIEDVVDTTYEAINWGYGEVKWGGRGEAEGLTEGLIEEVRRQTGVVQDWLEEQLGDGEFFGGEEFGWADLCVAPVLNRSVYYGFEIRGAKLQGWYGRILERGSVKETFGEMEAGAKTMGGRLREWFLEGGGVARREYRDHRLEWMIKSGGLQVVANALKDPKTIRFGWPDPTNPGSF